MHWFRIYPGVRVAGDGIAMVPAAAVHDVGCHPVVVQSQRELARNRPMGLLLPVLRRIECPLATQEPQLHL